jgi:hypothetical protein
VEYAAEASFLGTAQGTVCAGAAVGFLLGLGVATVSGRIGMRPSGEPFSGFRAVLTLGIAGIPTVTAVCWAGFALAGIGPAAVAVPAAVVLFLLTAVLYLRAVPGGRLTPAWAFAAVSAVALGLLATAMAAQFRVTGIVLLAGLLAAGICGGPYLHARRS